MNLVFVWERRTIGRAFGSCGVTEESLLVVCATVAAVVGMENWRRKWLSLCERGCEEARRVEKEKGLSRLQGMLSRR